MAATQYDPGLGYNLGNDVPCSSGGCRQNKPAAFPVLAPVAAEEGEAICDVSFFGDTTQRALLKASPPEPIGSTGRYRLRMRRASLRQPFGISFTTEGDKFFISEDVLHLGVRQHDQLLMANGAKVEFSEQCKRSLLQSLNLELTLQHHEPQQDTSRSAACSSTAPATPGLLPNYKLAGKDLDAEGGEGLSFRGWWVSMARSLAAKVVAELDTSCMPNSEGNPSQEPLRILLSASRPIPTDEGSGEFQIEIQRASLDQRFGIPFAQDGGDGGNDLGTLLIAEDLPQYGLRMGDALVSLNGLQNLASDDCQQILARSLTITLRLRREARHGFSQEAFVEGIDDEWYPIDGPDEFQVSETGEVMCGVPLVWCVGGRISV